MEQLRWQNTRGESLNKILGAEITILESENRKEREIMNSLELGKDKKEKTTLKMWKPFLYSKNE